MFLQAVTNISTSQGATDTDNSALMEKQQKAGPSRIASGDNGLLIIWIPVVMSGLGELETYGELGNGTTGTQLNASDSINPIYGSTVPVEVSNLSNIVSIAAGGNNCYALDSYGHVWAWGDGTDGELGNGTKGYSIKHGEYSNLWFNHPCSGLKSYGYCFYHRWRIQPDTH